jgi:nucleoside-diphosphate-sugar epimerase
MSILRPQIVCGLAIGAPMNVVASIGAFAAILREEGRPLFHPGSDTGCAEATSATLLAEAIEWVATHERCAGETYNIANGDALVWRDVWPAVAAHFGMELVAPEPLGLLSDEMPKREGLWTKMAEREGLRATSLAGLIGSSWQYADILWANPNPPGKPMLVSTIKARQHGFQACCDTEDMLVEQLAQMQREKLLPA